MNTHQWQGEVTAKLDNLEKQFANHLHHHFVITSGCVVAGVGQLLTLLFLLIKHLAT
jgi:hypothetical protein